MLRSVCESSSWKWYVPGASVCPGTLTGALKVTLVSRLSVTWPCAAATADVSSTATAVAASAEVIGLIDVFLLVSNLFAHLCHRLSLHGAYRLRLLLLGRHDERHGAARGAWGAERGRPCASRDRRGLSDGADSRGVSPGPQFRFRELGRSAVPHRKRNCGPGET